MAVKHLSYEDYLDEVTTLLTEIYTLADEVAIDIVMRAQADDFFTLHDEDSTLCTLEKAQEDARAVFKLQARQKATPKSPNSLAHHFYLFLHNV
jgi:hypothetical protein